MVSFARPEQLEFIAECAQSFALDNGAFTAWRAGKPITDWEAYYRCVERWKQHPGCDFALIPDVIGGTEEDNDALLADWPFLDCGVPVYHLDESIERLLALSRAMAESHSGPRAAIVHPACCCGGTASAKCWVRSVTKMASRS